jgi:hypothetical protein
MAGFVPNAWAARLLEALAGKTAIATGNVYLGLATAVPDDPLTATLSNITEVAVGGYARKQVPAFDAATTVAPIKITTPTAFAFDALTADMVDPALYAFLTDAAAGTAGTLRYLFQLEVPVLGRNGEPLTIPASTLIIE